MTVRWLTTAGNLKTIFERISQDIPLEATSDSGDVKFSLIAGNLPRGLRLTGSRITGSPTEVRRFTESRFVIRADDGTDIEDRTFSIGVDGADEPLWLTKEGFLNVGLGGNYFVLDNSRVDFQLEAYDPDVVAGDILEYYLIPSGGELPPGLSLTADGRIVGFTDPIFAVNIDSLGGYDSSPYDLTYLDKPEAKPNGFDTYLYDLFTYDFSDISKAPRRLSRSYTFVVAVSDGINEVRRLFRIWVVTNEFLKADNSIVQVDTNLFRADNVPNRIPIWITESDLGIHRANNYLTIYLDVYDPPTLSGTIAYLLLPVNPGKYRLKETGEIIEDGYWEISQNPLGFKYALKGDWDPSIQYKIGDAVFFNDREEITEGFLIYVCIAKHSNQRPSQESIYWTRKISTDTGKFFVDNPALFEVIKPETESQLPPGMTLDPTTGEIAGRIPYQSRVSKRYEFTLQAIDFPASLASANYVLQGDWSSKLNYTKNQAVRYQGLIYICLADHKNQLPNIDGSFYWQKSVSTAEKTFTVDIIGEIDSAIEWETDSDLGTIRANQPSTKSVKAKSLLYGGSVIYQVVGGNLPPGLELLGTGDIIGKMKQFSDEQGPGLTRFYEKVDSATEDSILSKNFSVSFDNATTSFDKKFRFKIKARDSANFAETIKEFNLTAVGDDVKTYANLYFKAFQAKDKRLSWSGFITNNEIFRPEEIYRYGDPSFGIQSEIKVLIYAGIESLEAVNYVQAMSRNHYRKQLRFGDVRYSIAKDPITQSPVYEAVYVEILDEYEKGKRRISQEIKLPNNINSNVLISYDSIRVDSDVPLVSDRDHQRLFPNSIRNMRRRIKSIGNRDRSFLPLWMRSIQEDSFVESGYLPVLVLCYAKPGFSDKIISRIKFNTLYASRGEWNSDSFYTTGDSILYQGIYYSAMENNRGKNPLINDNFWIKKFDFKSIDLTADRYIIDTINQEIQDQYLPFPQRDSLNKLARPRTDVTSQILSGTFNSDRITFDSDLLTFDQG